MIKESHGLFGRPSQVFTWEAGHSSSGVPLAGTPEEDREKQEATNENRSCLYGLMHTRLSMYMLGLPFRASGQMPLGHGPLLKM